MASLIHVFIGTKAQYIKTAPLLRLLASRDIPYRLIDSGQHAALTHELRNELGVREPDYRLGGDRDISTIPAMIVWTIRLAARMLRRDQLRRAVFGGHTGVCVVHGDTPSTLLSALMARRAGLKVAHLEAGLRSHSIRHPFPEELIRIVVMRISHLLFAPDESAVRNLEAMKLRGRIVSLPANTNVEALSRSLVELPAPDSGPAVVTTHRVENLKHRSRLEQLVDLIVRLAEMQPIRFVVHGPTEIALESKGLMPRLQQSAVEMLPLQPHASFTRMIAAAPFVITDGGSIQEECALLGVPTLLWRARTERGDGLGRNIVLSQFDTATIDEFLGEIQRYRFPPSPWTSSPSAAIADVLMTGLNSARG